MTESKIRHVVLSALTYHRREGLDKLLRGIARIERPAGLTFEVLIIDNSHNGGAESQVAGWARNFPFPLSYQHCPKRGLSPARNAALIAACGRQADALGFIDDDEVPSPQWLQAHLEALEMADVSVGTVEATFDVPPPAWLKRGRFLDVSGYSRHQRLRFGNTSNVLMRLLPVVQNGLYFDDSFALTGGEDTHFFHKLMASGSAIVFADDAKVEEGIVASRARLSWLWTRWRRTGQTNGQIRLKDGDSLANRCACVAGGLLRIGVGIAMALGTAPMALLGRGDLPAKGLRIAARGIGFVDCAVGYRTEEYRFMTR